MTTTVQFTMNAEQSLIPSSMPAQRVIELVVHAPQMTVQRERQRLNLALVIDRSGSMAGEKLEYVKQAAEHVLRLLKAQDRAALVAFDDEIQRLAPSLPVTDENRTEMSRAIRQMRSGGMTNLSDGWLAGAQEAASAAEEGMLTRTLLLTDGQANVGITDLEELARHARELSVRGISTSTFGVGHGFNEHLLEAMSNQGGGNFYYIETASEIPALFRREFQELEAVSIRELSITIQLPPQVHVEVLGGWRSDCQSGQLHLDLGSLTAGRRQEIYLRVLTPPAMQSEQLIFQASLNGKGEAGEDLQAAAEVIFRYASQEEAAAEPKQQDVLQRYASVEMADVATQALKLERVGENKEASRLVNQSIQANLAHMPPAEVDRYSEMAQRLDHGMSEGDRKSSHYSAYHAKRRRDSK